MNYLLLNAVLISWLMAFVTGRGTQEDAIISLSREVYLAFQPFSWTGLQESSNRDSIVARMGNLGITASTILFLM